MISLTWIRNHIRQILWIRIQSIRNHITASKYMISFPKSCDVISTNYIACLFYITKITGICFLVINLFLQDPAEAGKMLVLVMEEAESEYQTAISENYQEHKHN